MDPVPEISPQEINSRWDELTAVSGKTLMLLGPRFTQTPEGHIQTDIAAASSLAGLIVLQETVANLPELISQTEPGSVLLSEVHQGQKDVFLFMSAFAGSNGLDPHQGWGEAVPDDHQPLLSCQEMTRRIAPDFYRFCEEEKLDKLYWKIAAAMTSLKLVFAGLQTSLLDPQVGKAIAAYYVVAGSKTVPYEDALWPEQ